MTIPGATTLATAGFGGNLLSESFLVDVLVLAAIYGIFALGLQLNVGAAGLLNFGQAGFMALGAYSMAILVIHGHLSFWIAWPLATVITAAAAVFIGIVTVRLRADYIAITTICFSEIIRYAAQNIPSLTGGNLGIYGYDSSWQRISKWMQARLAAMNIRTDPLLPLAIVAIVIFVLATVVLTYVRHTPWGRLMRALRADEDAVRALGKNTFALKLQVLTIGAALGALAGYLLALELTILVPSDFITEYTFIGFAMIILAGLGSYAGLLLSSLIMWVLLESTRYAGIGLAADRLAALRYVIVGAGLMLLIAFRPQGLFGNRDEMIFSD